MNDPDAEFKEFIFNVFKSLGFDTLIGKVVSILFLEPREVSMEELAEKTGYSLSSISTKTKMLVESGAAQRVKKPGSKKIYFHMENDVKKLMLGKFDVMFRVYLNPAIENLPGIIKRYKENTKGTKNQAQRDKLKNIENYHRDIVLISRLFQKFIDDVKKLEN